MVIEIYEIIQNLITKPIDLNHFSASCKAKRYEIAMREMGMKAKCFDFDRIAVKCFNNPMFNVTVSLFHSNTKISCRALVSLFINGKIISI